MTAPNRPWEGAMYNSFAQPNPGLQGVRTSAMNQPPPLPPRQRMPRGYGYSSGYSAMPGYGYSSMGYGYGYSPFSYGGMGYDNRFSSMAEESAQPAFDSIESLVRGFSSVSMMLESTLQALHMSFRAVLSVADNMSRVKLAVVDFFSALAVFRLIKTFYQRILSFLGLVNNVEVAWNEVETPRRQTSGIRWSTLAFLGAIIAGPTLVYKYLLSDETDEQDVQLIGLYDFERELPTELSFRKGEILTCKVSNLKRAWIPAKKGSQKGLIPSNRVQILKKVISQNQAPTSTPNEPNLT